MNAPHVPVLLDEVVDALAPKPGQTVVDGTFGAGGYARAILAAADAAVVAIDRDASALACGSDLVRDAGGRLVLVQDRFSNLEQVVRTCGHDRVDGVVLDIGVSSMQLDEAERGFVHGCDGPLDMRMAARARPPPTWSTRPSSPSWREFCSSMVRSVRAAGSPR
jgi:16S rRNA (cytosine1402-N4)-methyltransferase